jgi:hypothetical protein
LFRNKRLQPKPGPEIIGRQVLPLGLNPGHGLPPRRMRQSRQGPINQGPAEQNRLLGHHANSFSRIGQSRTGTGRESFRFDDLSLLIQLGFVVREKLKYAKARLDHRPAGDRACLCGETARP